MGVSHTGHETGAQGTGRSEPELGLRAMDA